MTSAGESGAHSSSAVARKGGGSTKGNGRTREDAAVKSLLEAIYERQSAPNNLKNC